MTFLQRLRLRLACWRRGHDWGQWRASLPPLNRPYWEPPPGPFRICNRCHEIQCRDNWPEEEPALAASEGQP